MLPTASTKGRSGPQPRPNLFFPYLRRIVKVLRPSSKILTHMRFSPKSNTLINRGNRGTQFSLLFVALFIWFAVVDRVMGVIFNRNINTPSITSTFFSFAETKNQWARDDPAFVVICSLLFSVALIAYCAAYDHSAGHAVFVVISSLFVHFFLIGAILATFC
ncbi:hypothetical protein SASPL_119672 [Salvia splendens]|uniref:Uncharacterized protein n=1 Tax=Salvia splendens TaxID=180675 RepID=A0A8X8ZUW3_SALSN|nr:hypothetical protein SASPL_119672 [Salvia splendens]